MNDDRENFAVKAIRYLKDWKKQHSQKLSREQDIVIEMILKDLENV